MNASTHEEKLSFGTKLAFGVGDLGPAVVAAINGFFLNAFLLDVAGLRPATAGAIFLIVKIWDAVNDPLVGMLSDRTHTRWGRRRPWLLFAAIPFGIFFFLQWVVPPFSEAGKFWYYLLVAVLLDTGYTAVNVPYAALTPELTHDYDERTSLSSFRFSFSILGGVFAAFLHTIIVDSAGNVFSGYLTSAAVWSFFIIVPHFITFAFTREVHFKEQRPEPLNYLNGMKVAFQNKAFIYVTIIYLLSWLSIQFVQGNLILYVRYWMGDESRFGMLVLAVQVSAFLFVLLWTRVSARIGKKRTYYLGMSAWVLVSIALFFLQPGQIGVLFGLAILAGAGVSIGYLIPWSMLPDVVELDELETGQRREGIFYGFFVFLQKLGLSLGLALSNFVLEAAGYITPVPGAIPPAQPESVLLALRVFVSFVPAFVLLLSFLFVRTYPITKKRHDEMRAELAQRRYSPESD
ncbi:MAG: MFS transporter [Anaerolineales bacterium]|jgi:GPH family glycoside/pentoside/hexuronide:cation symporter